MKRLTERQKAIRQLDAMSGVKIMKKKTKTPKQLKAKYEHTIRDLVIQRDGNKCAIAGLPYHVCRGRLVADHRPVKRKNNRYFFDPKNLTCVCEGANFLAEFDPAINAAICDVVKKREGIDTYEYMIVMKSIPFKVTEDYVLFVIEQLKKLCGSK